MEEMISKDINLDDTILISEEKAQAIMDQNEKDIAAEKIEEEKRGKIPYVLITIIFTFTLLMILLVKRK